MKNLRFCFVALLTGLVIFSCQKDDPTPTCTDGIQNGTEIGIDCGGDCAACEVLGCTDPEAHNYDPAADTDDGSCETCIDGIQNGDESGVDCGGLLCDTCLIPTEHILGPWRTIEFTYDGTNLLEALNIQDEIYDFMLGGIYERVQVKDNSSKNFFQGGYSISNDGLQLSLSVGSDVGAYNSLISNDFLECEVIDDNGILITVKWQKINEDLCIGISCDNGVCFHGYCICEDGFEGSDCSQIAGSVGTQNAHTIFDKGFYSDNWRYIEVSKSPLNTNGLSWGCKPKDLSHEVGDAIKNFQIMAPSGCDFDVPKAIFASSQSQYNGSLSDLANNWFLPTSQELEIICTMKDELDYWPNSPTWIWSSSAQSSDTGDFKAYGIMSHLCPSEEKSINDIGLVYPVRYY